MSTLETLKEIGNKLSSSRGLRGGLSLILETLKEHNLIIRGFISLYETETERLVPLAIEGYSVTEFRRLENQTGKKLIDDIFKSGNRLYVKKTSLEDWFKFITARDMETSFFGVAIYLGKKIIGVLGVETTFEEPCDTEQLFSPNRLPHQKNLFPYLSQ